MHWYTNWHVYGPVALGIAISGLATARSVFVPVDPNAARTWWQSMILFLQLWLTAVAPEGTVGIAGTRASFPLLHRPKMDTKMKLPDPLPPPPSTGGAASFLILFASGTLFATAVAGTFVAACVTTHGVVVSDYCKDPAHVSEARCKAEHVAVDCGVPEVVKIVKGIVSQVFAALMGQNYDTVLGDIVKQLKVDGATDPLGIVACAIDEILSKSGVTMSQMEQTVVQTNAQIYLKNHPASIKPRVK